MKPREKAFLVRLVMPPEARVSDVKELLENAIKCYPGSLMPNDPMFELDHDSVRVTLHQPKPRARVYTQGRL